MLLEETGLSTQTRLASLVKASLVCLYRTDSSIGTETLRVASPPFLLKYNTSIDKNAESFRGESLLMLQSAFFERRGRCIRPFPKSLAVALPVGQESHV